MADIVKRNPFVKDKAIDQARLYVTFLSDDPPNNAVELLQPLVRGDEQMRVVGRAVYFSIVQKAMAIPAQQQRHRKAETRLRRHYTGIGIRRKRCWR